MTCVCVCVCVCVSDTLELSFHARAGDVIGIVGALGKTSSGRCALFARHIFLLGDIVEDAFRRVVV